MKTDRYNKENESDLIQTIKSKKTTFDETSKDRSKHYYLPLIVKVIDATKSNNVTQSIDFNSLRKKSSVDRSNLENYSKTNFSKKNSKEK